MAVNHYKALVREYSYSAVDVKGRAELLRNAIGYAPAFMYLDTEAYQQIDNWAKETLAILENDDPDAPGSQNMWQERLAQKEKFENIVLKLIPKMGLEWLQLGCPATEEDWGRAKYPQEEENDPAVD